MIKIIDNFFPTETFLQFSHSIENHALWKYMNGTAILHPHGIEKADDFFFIHDAMNQNNLIQHIFNGIKEKIDCSLNLKIVSCNLNLTLKNYNGYQTPIHVDYKHDHYVLVIYMNEADGNTILYDKYWNEKDSFYEIQKHKESLKTIKIISPKPNRCLFFDGRYYHSYFFPRNCNKRIVINAGFFNV